MRTGRLLLCGFAATLAALAVFLLLPGALATNDPPGSGGTVYGDWTVTDSKSYSGVSITIVNGSLTIKSGGSLSLSGVTLLFDIMEDGVYALKVDSGGALTMKNGCLVSSTNSSAHYKFVIRGSATIDACTVQETWGDNESWAGGIQIYSDSVSVTNSTIERGKTGGISIFDCSPVVSDNVIRYNGQDGQSPLYCYGIYARNTTTAFRGNIITDNRYLHTWYDASYSSYSPPLDPGYFNIDDKYYYGPAYDSSRDVYYYYRYQYDYGNRMSNVYGTGIRLEGGSRCTIHNNTITKNGYALPASTPTTVSPTVEGYYDIYELWVYLYEYNYYIANWVYGTGLHAENSTLDITENFFDRNGFEPYQNYVSGDNRSMSWYYGANIRLVSSNGNITGNTINNAAVLIDLVRSSPCISGNSMLSDYLGGGTYSYCFMGTRTAYSIKGTRSSPAIINNTLTVQYYDYQYYAGGTFWFFADAMYTIELMQSSDILIQGNTFTIDCRGTGRMPLVLLNLSLKASGVQLRDNTFEYKMSGSPSTPSTSVLLQAGALSDAYVENCVFKLPAPGGGKPPFHAAVAQLGSYIKMVNCTVQNPHYGLSALDFSSVEVIDTRITGVQTVSINLDEGSRAYVLRCELKGEAGSMGVRAAASWATIQDSVLLHDIEFQLNRSATVEVYNSTHNKNTFRVLDGGSYLNVSWPLALLVTWQNDYPASGVHVTISTAMGEYVFSGVTDERGRLTRDALVKEYTVHNFMTIKYTPHRLSVSKGRVSATEMLMLDGPASVRMILVDNAPPELKIRFPANWAQLNTLLVTFSGTASDEESGLREGAVTINIDNTGWSEITVSEDTRWSYTRLLSDGTHVAKVCVQDVAGNTARILVQISIDTSAPSLFLFTPKDGSATSERTITVHGVTDEGAVVTINGLPTPVLKRHFSMQISLEEGPNTIVITASDPSGNSKTIQVRVTLDTEPPLLEVTSPADGAFLNQEVISFMGRTEPSAVVRVNGLPAHVSGTNFVSLISLSEGVNVIVVTARDAAGNSIERTITVYLDTSPPDLTVFTPRDALWTNQSRLLVTGA
ncbi:MAG: right-handed parallel beta-helix repeat-containing protein, partial [Thermoplasmata archaeon]